MAGECLVCIRIADGARNFYLAAIYFNFSSSTTVLRNLYFFGPQMALG
jgi:hypothetical protein